MSLNRLLAQPVLVALALALGTAATRATEAMTASAPLPLVVAGYDVVVRVAEIRAHPGYGAAFSAGTNPEAPNGLELPAPPRAECLTREVIVRSLDKFNSEASRSCRRIVLLPSDVPYVGQAIISGEDIEAVFTGATITPKDDSFALMVVKDARRVRTIGGTFNNVFAVGGYRRVDGKPKRNFVQDVHISKAQFTGLYTQGLTDTYYGDGVVVAAHRLLVEQVSVRAANGGFFVEGGTNLILANSDIVVPKLARHENPVRINGADLVAVLDSRLRTELGPGQSGPIKHTWRMHAAYEGAGVPGGRMIVRNVQSEGGGAMTQYPGVEGPNPQSSLLVVHGWRYYRAPDVVGNNIAAFPHRNDFAGSPHKGSVMNAAVWMEDNIVYSDDAPAGTPFMRGGNVPPGKVMSSVYAPYRPPPAWKFR